MVLFFAKACLVSTILCNSAEIMNVLFPLRSELTRVNSEPIVFDYERRFENEFTRYVAFLFILHLANNTQLSCTQVDVLVYIDVPSYPVRFLFNVDKTVRRSYLIFRRVILSEMCSQNSWKIRCWYLLPSC